MNWHETKGNLGPKKNGTLGWWYPHPRLCTTMATNGTFCFAPNCDASLLLNVLNGNATPLKADKAKINPYLGFLFFVIDLFGHQLHIVQMILDLKYASKSNNASFYLLLILCACEFYLFLQNKLFQINIRNIILSSKNTYCSFDWNCVKCQDPFRENWPLGNVRASFHEMQLVPSIPAESGACPWTADRWLLMEKKTRGR